MNENKQSTDQDSSSVLLQVVIGIVACNACSICVGIAVIAYYWCFRRESSQEEQ